jgi:hypothetical protein
MNSELCHKKPPPSLTGARRHDGASGAAGAPLALKSWSHLRPNTVNPAKIQPGCRPRPQEPSLFDRCRRQIGTASEKSEKQPASNDAELLPSTLLSPGIAPSSRYNAIRALARALRSPSFRTRPSKKLHYRYHENIFSNPAPQPQFHVQALGIMPLWQLSGPRARSSLAFP